MEKYNEVVTTVYSSLENYMQSYMSSPDLYGEHRQYWDNIRESVFRVSSTSLRKLQKIA